MENGDSCPFEENWEGVSVGLDGEMNFPQEWYLLLQMKLPAISKEINFL